MAFKYFPHTEGDITEMLARIGVESLEGLYDEVPQELKLQRDYDLPSSKSEEEVRREMERLGDRNTVLTCFAGGGVYDHYTPAVVKNLVSRQEFLTSYTPYQAEISQGTLQYIFEYQSMMASLTGLDVSNASMYDGTTATAEAMLMAMASVRKADRVLISGALNPAVLRVCKCYALFHNIGLIVVPAKDGETDREFIKAELAKGGVAGVIVGQPNYYGIIEDISGLSDCCHASKALLIMNCPASTLAVLRTPGEWGADIAVGDAQSLGMPMNYGGPYLGYFCAKNELVRKMPGRIVGATEDTKGQRTFVLTLQAREQHIRRQKATSNICSNQGLMTLFVTIYMSLLGKKGLKQVNCLSYRGAHYLHDRLIAKGLAEDAFGEKPYLNEFCVKAHFDVEAMQKKLQAKGLLAGISLGDGLLLLAVTERRTKEEIDRLVELIAEARYEQ